MTERPLRLVHSQSIISKPEASMSENAPIQSVGADLELRVRMLEALATAQQSQIQALERERGRLLEHMEWLEDSLAAHIALEEHEREGGKTYSLEEVAEELGL